MMNVLQGAAYSLSAFSLGLSELPKAWMAHQDNQHDNNNNASSANTHPGGQADSSSELQSAIDWAIGQLAKEVGDASQMCEAMSSALRPHAVAVAAGSGHQEAAALLRCCEVAAKTVGGFTGHVSRGALVCPGVWG